MRVSRSLAPFNTFFDDFFTKDLINYNNNVSKTWSQRPSVNIKETSGDYQIELAAPGMKKEDFSIEIKNDQLTIAADSKTEQKEENSKYVRKEFNYNKFERSFTLPSKKYDEEGVQAKYEDGILLILIPKSEIVKKEVKQIEIA
ncbi:MAG: Hsp20/alpha crystallin family protein [Flavobacteriales bacterium]|nr:Hsp20/alpha crystallin family protein [Flavobacteriales bacterium]